MMRFSRYDGSPNIGVFAVVNENLGFVASDADPSFVKDMESVLGVKTFMTTISGSFLVGSLVAMNSNGAIVTDMVDGKELELIGSVIDVATISDRSNAAGNNILVNDNGAIINPELGKKSEKVIEDFLGVEVVRSMIAGCPTVGTVCRATNIGCVCSSEASDEDMKLISDVLKVEAVRATVNHGIKFVGAGILANSKGAMVGDQTTPIEMGKIEDGLMLY